MLFPRSSAPPSTLGRGSSYPLSRHPRDGSPPIPDGRTDSHPRSSWKTTATMRTGALGGRWLPPSVGSEGSCDGLRARGLAGTSAEWHRLYDCGAPDFEVGSGRRREAGAAVLCSGISVSAAPSSPPSRVGAGCSSLSLTRDPPPSLTPGGPRNGPPILLRALLTFSGIPLKGTNSTALEAS